MKRHSLLPLLLAPITLSAVLSLTLTQANGQQDEGPPEVRITEERLSGYRDFDCDQIKKELTAVAERYEYEATPRMTDGTMFFGGNIGYIIAIKELVRTANGMSCENRSFDCSDYPQTCNDLIRDGFDAFQSGEFGTALKEIRPLAEHGISPAQFALGICYEFGNGVAVDQTAAVEWYRRAADQGHPTAQRNLGNMYFNGWGVPQDMDKAVEWYEKAAAQGNISAQFNIGYVYASVKEDYVAAREWWLKSANAGYPPAMSNLGVIYRDGLGTAQDTIQAYMWFYLAAELADQQAARWRDELAGSMSAEQIAKAEKLGREWRGVEPIDVPGNSHAASSAVLAADTLQMVMMMDSAKDKNCTDRRLANAEIVEKGSDYKFQSGVLISGSWTEVWTIDRCGTKYDWQIVFTADGKGGTAFEVSEYNEN